LGDGATWESGKHARWSPTYTWGWNWPTYGAAGASDSASPPTGSLADEIERFPVELVTDLGNVEMKVRFGAKVPPHQGVGLWKELGLFWGNARVAMLSPCNSVGTWTGGSGLHVTTTNVCHGPGSIFAYGNHATPFQNLSLDAYTDTFAETDRFQVWYYIDNKAVLSDNVDIYLSDSNVDPTWNYYLFRTPKASISDGWNWLSWRINQYTTKTGTVTPNNIVSCKLVSNKSGWATEQIDKLRLWGNDGTFWARVVPDPPIEKQYGEIKWVYWHLEFPER
jgi:hypothetical protein